MRAQARGSHVGEQVVDLPTQGVGYRHAAVALVSVELVAPDTAAPVSHRPPRPVRCTSTTAFGMCTGAIISQPSTGCGDNVVRSGGRPTAASLVPEAQIWRWRLAKYSCTSLRVVAH
jgi:hypothetical protein